MLVQYGEVAVGKNIPIILQELKGIFQDLKEQIQIRLWRWGGLGGRTLELKCEEDVAECSGALVAECTDDHDLYQKPQRKRQRGIEKLLPQSKFQNVCTGRPTKVQKLTVEHSPGQSSNVVKNALGERQKRMLQLHDSVLGVIYENLMQIRAQDLHGILHSIKFPRHREEGWERHWERIRAVKLCFEKSVFKTIQFMFEFELISENDLRGFFSATSTLYLTGTHLVDLFDIAKYKSYKPLDFCPTISFVCHQLQTEHLHEALKALDQTRQSQVIHTCLSAQVRAYDKLIGNRLRNSQLERVHNFFCENNFLEIPKKGTQEVIEQNVPHDTNPLYLEDFCRKIVKFFQNPPPASESRKVFQLSIAQYVLNYHMINFLETYYPGTLICCFNNDDEFKKFEKKTKIYRLAFEMEQAIKNGYNYMYMPYFSDRNLNSLFKNKAEEEKEISMQEFVRISHHFKREYDTLIKMSSEDPRMREWLQGDNVAKFLLGLFYHEAEDWESLIEAEKVKRQKTNYIDENKRKNFMLPNSRRPVRDYCHS